MTDGDFETVLARMREEYRSKLPGKADRIDELVAAGDGAELTGYLHKLGGTAGSYGLIEVADQALAIEDALKGGAGLDELAPEFARLVDLLRS